LVRSGAQDSKQYAGLAEDQVAWCHHHSLGAHDSAIAEMTAVALSTSDPLRKEAMTDLKGFDVVAGRAEDGQTGFAEQGEKGLWSAGRFKVTEALSR